jgi:hypothetical protein
VARQRPEKAEALKVGLSEKFRAAAAGLNVDSIRQLDGSIEESADFGGDGVICKWRA